jgi:hypothetical protein
MIFCKYKNILGEPRTGVHSVRINDIAVFDVLLTFALAYWISSENNLEYYSTLVYTFILGIVVHWLFCVNSTVNQAIFGTV